MYKNILFVNQHLPFGKKTNYIYKIIGCCFKKGIAIKKPVDIIPTGYRAFILI